MKLTQGLGVVALLALVSGCGKGELILTGQRQDVRDAVIGGTPDEAVSLAPGENRSVPVSLGAARANADWTQPAGNAQHAPGNVALATTPQPLWAAPIGAGENRKHRITAEPVIAGGRIFTLDSRAVVTATGTGGATVWQTDLTPSADRADDASGGGLATGGGAVFATTGFGDLVALDAASGKELWRQRFDAAVTGAPAYDGGRVYAVSLDGAAWALDASNGKVLWTLTGTPSAAGINGGSAPAVDARQVVFPFSSGQLLSVDKARGTGLWSSYVAGERRGRAYATISDVTGVPVIAGGMVIAGSAAGQIAAVNVDTGQPVWTLRDGALNPVATAGGALFLVNDEDQLLRLDAATGAEVWRIDMPYFTKDRDRRRRDIYTHFGPLIAGGHLVTVSSDGLLRSFDPASGALLGTVALGAPAAAAPAIANGVLYVVGQDGRLRAFR